MCVCVSVTVSVTVSVAVTVTVAVTVAVTVTVAVAVDRVTRHFGSAVAGDRFGFRPGGPFGRVQPVPLKAA